MSIRSIYSEEQLKNGISIEEYMRNATFEDILHLGYQFFDVAVLARVSTTHEEQMKAYDIQMDSLLKLVEETPHFRLDSRNIYEDRGYSGLIADKRPGLQLVCKRAKERKFNIFIVDSVSRLARNVRELFDIIDDFRSLGIGILIMKERYWTFNMTHTDILRLAVDGGLAQAESMNTGVRVKSHMKDIAQEQLLGGDMFGYRLKKDYENKANNSLVQDPVEAYAVKTIFDRYTSKDPKLRLTSSSLVRYLIDNNMRTFAGDLNWTPSKVTRVLANTKYMGYQLPGKSEIVDTVKKKKVSTHIEPIRDKVDANGNVIEKGNLVKIPCVPIVDENTWWDAYNIRMSRSSKNSANIKGRKSGLRVSKAAIGRKAYCSCGYCLSYQYTHAATEEKAAMYRLKCRWQVDHDSKYTRGGFDEGQVICDNPAVGEAKFWLSSKYVFRYMFKNGKKSVLDTLDLIEKYKSEDVRCDDGNTVADLEAERARWKKRIGGYQDMRADGEMCAEDYKVKVSEAEKRIEEIDALITKQTIEEAKREKSSYDLNAIRERLDTLIDLKGYKVSEEVIDMFVERIIYRGVVNECDEFVWVMNLSGIPTDASARYRINHYDPKYAQSLKDDKTFNIIAQMVIPKQECLEYVKNELHRSYKDKFWRDIVLKVAIA